MIILPSKSLWLPEWFTAGKTGRKSTGRVCRNDSGRAIRHVDASTPCTCQCATTVACATCSSGRLAKPYTATVAGFTLGFPFETINGESCVTCSGLGNSVKLVGPRSFETWNFNGTYSGNFSETSCTAIVAAFAGTHAKYTTTDCSGVSGGGSGTFNALLRRISTGYFFSLWIPGSAVVAFYGEAVEPSCDKATLSFTNIFTSAGDLGCHALPYTGYTPASGMDATRVIVVGYGGSATVTICP